MSPTPIRPIDEASARHNRRLQWFWAVVLAGVIFVPLAVFLTRLALGVL